MLYGLRELSQDLNVYFLIFNGPNSLLRKHQRAQLCYHIPRDVVFPCVHFRRLSLKLFQRLDEGEHFNKLAQCREQSQVIRYQLRLQFY